MEMIALQKTISPRDEVRASMLIYTKLFIDVDLDMFVAWELVLLSNCPSYIIKRSPVVSFHNLSWVSDGWVGLISTSLDFELL
uniref:Putative ovule protein n=1 Tax=Solanum chacoense TaxID=4108 RepID=A0A0V0H445_SOLCH